MIQQFLTVYKRYLSNLSATFVSQAVSALSILFLTPVLLKSLGQEQFGWYGVLLNIIVFSSIFDFGLNIGLLRRLIHQKEASVWVINAMFFFFLSVFVVSVPLYYFLYRSGFLAGDQRLLLTALCTALIVVQNIIAVFFDVIIQSANKIFVGKLIRVVKTITEFFVLFFLCRKGSVVLLLQATALINMAYIGVLFLYSKKEVNYQLSWAYFKPSVLWNHIQYSFWYFQNALATVLVYNAQIVLISSFVDSGSVTKYLLVTRFFDVLRMGLTNFTVVLFPSLSLLQAQENWQQLKRMFLRVLLRVALLVLLVFSLVLAFGQPVFVYWSKYQDPMTIQLFQIYAVYVALLIIDHVPTVFLSAFKFNKFPAIVSTIQGALGLLLIYLVIPRYGIVGAITASLLAFLCTNFLFNPWYLIRKMNAQFQTRIG